LFFLIYLAGMVGVVVLNLANSKVSSMRQLQDSEGNVCGVDAGYEKHTRLMMFKFTAPYRSVCVTECPKFDYNQIKFNADGTSTEKIEPVYIESFAKVVEYGKNKPIKKKCLQIFKFIGYNTLFIISYLKKKNY
jgi:hypothetical protein